MATSPPFTASTRANAALVLQAILQEGRSLSAILIDLDRHQAKYQHASSDRAWIQSIVFTVLRELPLYEHLIQQLVDKPIKAKIRVLHYVLMVGLAQLRYFNTPAHAALSETVDACVALKHSRLKGFVNAVLRQYLRQQTALEQQLVTQFRDQDCFPAWFRKAIQQAWPEQAANIFKESQLPGPVWLRVNNRVLSTAQYSQELTQAEIQHHVDSRLPAAICLEQTTDIRLLPLFDQGSFSIQDVSAQFASTYFSIPESTKKSLRVLDACAAPGGKAAALAERFNGANVSIDALELSVDRIPRMQENFQRLQLDIRIQQGDACQPDAWWDGQLYDRILIDAPCSATGIIRRQPDIRWHRRANDIPELVQLQQDILTALWPLLVPGGELLYATCSILPDENQLQIKHFLEQHADAHLETRFIPQGQEYGYQIFPGEHQGDGFFYALLHKRP